MINTCSNSRIAFAGVENVALLAPAIEIGECQHAIQTEYVRTRGLI